MGLEVLIVSMDWQTLREIVAPIVGSFGGFVGLIGGGLGIYYASTANRILLKRFRREEEAKEVETRADDLLRRVHESSGSGSTMQRVTLELTDELDKKAAWKLYKDGTAEVPRGNHYTFFVDNFPKALRRDMEMRSRRECSDDHT